MIAKIFGVYTLKTSVYAPLDIIVMENVTKMNNTSNHSVTFDLKGSTYKRKVPLTS